MLHYPYLLIERGGRMKLKEIIERGKLLLKHHQRYVMIALGVAFLTGILGSVYLNHRIRVVLNQAISYYEENDLYSFETIRYELYAHHAASFDAYLTEEAKAVLDDYINKKITYYEACGQVERIEVFANSPLIIKEYRDQIEQLYESRAYFEEAEKKAINKEWEDAYHLYLKVSEIDPNYEKAQELAASSRRWWAQDVLVEAVTYYEEQNYDQALETVTKGIELFEEDNTFYELKEAIELAMEEGTTEDKWGELKDKITSSIQSGIESIGNFFDKIFGR